MSSDYSLSVDWPALLWHRVRQLGAQPVQGPIREATEADIAARRAIIAAAKASRTKDLSPRDAQAQATPSSTSSASPTSAPPTSTPSSADAPSAEASTSSCYANAERAGDGRSTRPAHHCRDHPIWACPSQAKLQFQLQTIRTRQTCASTPVLWGPSPNKQLGLHAGPSREWSQRVHTFPQCQLASARGGSSSDCCSISRRCRRRCRRHCWSASRCSQTRRLQGAGQTARGFAYLASCSPVT